MDILYQNCYCERNYGVVFIVLNELYNILPINWEQTGCGLVGKKFKNKNIFVTTN